LSDPTTSRAVLVACAVLVALGLGRLAHERLGVDPRAVAVERAERLDAPYRRLAPELPPDARLGYLSTDGEPNAFADERYVHAAYALAPRVVSRGVAGVSHVVLTFDDARGLRDLCARHRLVPIAVDPRGVAIARVERGAL
jgi:hypothetical protein